MGTSRSEPEVEDGRGAEAQRGVETSTQEVGQGKRSEATKWQEGQVQTARRTAIYNRGSCVDGSDGDGNRFWCSSHICSNTGGWAGNRSCHWHSSSPNGSSGSRAGGEKEAKTERDVEGVAHTGSRGASQGMEDGKTETSRRRQRVSEEIRQRMGAKGRGHVCQQGVCNARDARPIVLKETVLSSKSQDAHQNRWQVCRGINSC